MNINVNLFPLDVVGSCPMESIAQLADSTCGTLEALAVYRPDLVNIEDIIYRCLYADGHLSSFQSSRSISIMLTVWGIL